MKEIPLHNRVGQVVAVAKVDDEDYETLTRYSWCLTDTGYAMRGTRVGGRGGRFVSFKMHREILNAPKGITVDHRDGDKLNNCRSNLRLATQSENNANKGARKNNKSGYLGVSRMRHRWKARIQKHGKVTYIGDFATPEEAHRAYVEAAKRIHGEFAHA